MRQLVCKCCVSQSNPVHGFKEISFGIHGAVKIISEIGSNRNGILCRVVCIFKPVGQHSINHSWSFSIECILAHACLNHQHFISVKHVATFPDIDIERESPCVESKAVDN